MGRAPEEMACFINILLYVMNIWYELKTLHLLGYQNLPKESCVDGVKDFSLPKNIKKNENIQSTVRFELTALRFVPNIPISM